MKLEKFTNFQKAFDAISLTMISEILVGSFSFYIFNFEFPLSLIRPNEIKDNSLERDLLYIN